MYWIIGIVIMIKVDAITVVKLLPGHTIGLQAHKSRDLNQSSASNDWKNFPMFPWE